MTEESDLDILVVLPDGGDITSRREALIASLGSLNRPIDLVLVTESEYARRVVNADDIVGTAVRTGQCLYSRLLA